MTGLELRKVRERAGWSQDRLATSLGVTQAYLSLMETGKRPVPDRLLRKAVRVLELAPTGLPLGASRSAKRATNEDVADELSRLEYPGLAYRRKGRPTRNPAETLLDALALDDLDVRLLEALPWLVLRFEGLDFDLLLDRARARDLQNRLGFTLALAREVAAHEPAFAHRLGDLARRERRLEVSRLAREDTFGPPPTTARMRRFIRDHRSEAAEHWNLLTDLKREHLPYAGKDS